MTEFALIAPVFFLMVMGAFDFSLMMYTIASGRFAAADAARVEAQVGSDPGINACNSTCASLGLGQGSKGTDCDADCQAISNIHQSPIFTSKLARVLEIDIIKQTASANRTLSDSNTRNTYTPGGLACSGRQYTVTYRNGATRPYCVVTGYSAYTSRDVIFGQTDALKVDIVYEYDWKAGLMNVVFPQPPELHASYVVNLEPQGYR